MMMHLREEKIGSQRSIRVFTKTVHPWINSFYSLNHLSLSVSYVNMCTSTSWTSLVVL